MLKSELNRLETYVEESPEDLAAAVKEECARLSAIWVQELFKPVKDDVLRRYIQFHQAGLIALSDAVGEKLAIELEHLIGFLRQSFYNYFDTDRPVTAYFLRRVRGEVEEFLLHVETRSKPVYIDRSLVDCIYTSVKTKLDVITYRKADELLHFIALLREHLQIYSSTTTEELANILYRANFNSTSFLHWFQHQLEKEMGRAAEPDNWIDHKVAELEELGSAKLHPFDAENTPIDLAVLSWLHSQKTGLQPGIPLPGQLGLNLSVAQFALFIRLFQVTGCFRETNLTKIQCFFSAHFTTKKQDHISFKSFGRSFYAVDQSTAAVVRDALKRMIGYIDQHYFPK